MKKTLGVDVTPYDYRINNNKFRLNIWDCGGDERFMGLGKLYTSGSDLIMIFGENNEEFVDWNPDVTRIYVNAEDSMGIIIDKIRTALH